MTTERKIQVGSAFMKRQALLMDTIQQENLQQAARISALEVAVKLYLEKPGCNIPSRQTALQKLRWALDTKSP